MELAKFNKILLKLNLRLLNRQNKISTLQIDCLLWFSGALQASARWDVGCERSCGCSRISRGTNGKKFGTYGYWYSWIGCQVQLAQERFGFWSRHQLQNSGCSNGFEGSCSKRSRLLFWQCMYSKLTKQSNRRRSLTKPNYLINYLINNKLIALVISNYFCKILNLRFLLY